MGGRKSPSTPARRSRRDWSETMARPRVRHSRIQFLTVARAVRYRLYMAKNRIRIMYKVWLDCDGKAFGEGPDRLLRLVEVTGSLHKAAAEMKMSYRKAWLMLQAIERRLGYPLLERKVGGVSGGGSQLTPAARELMRRYEAFRQEIQEKLQDIWAEHFG